MLAPAPRLHYVLLRHCGESNWECATSTMLAKIAELLTSHVSPRSLARQSRREEGSWPVLGAATVFWELRQHCVYSLLPAPHTRKSCCPLQELPVTTCSPEKLNCSRVLLLCALTCCAFAIPNPTCLIGSHQDLLAQHGGRSQVATEAWDQFNLRSSPMYGTTRRGELKVPSCSIFVMHSRQLPQMPPPLTGRGPFCQV